jgi:Fe(3+) dicitrate transport protein
VLLKVGRYHERSDETYLGLTDSDFRDTPLRRYAASQNDVMRADHQQVSLRYFTRPTRWLDVTATAYRNDFSRNWYKLQSVLGSSLSNVLGDPAGHDSELTILRGADAPSDALRVRANNRDYVAEGVQAVLGVTVGDAFHGHAVEAGIRAHRDREDRFQHEDGFAMADGVMTQTLTGLPGSQSNRVSDANAVSMYVQDEITLGRLRLTPGIRFENIRFTRSDFSADDPDRRSALRRRESTVRALIPGIGASFEISDGARVFAGLHRGFGPPGPSADDEARPEQSLNYEVGAKVSHGGLDADVSFFYTDYSNILGASTLSTGGAGTGDLFNGGSVRAGGVEAALMYDAPVGVDRSLAVPLRLTVTYTRASFRSAFESDYDPWGVVSVGDRLPYLPVWQTFASAGLRSLRWSLNVSTTYSGRMRTTAGQGPVPDAAATSAMFLVNLSTEYRAFAWGSVFAGLSNALNDHYVVARRPAGARPGLPRTLSAGLRFDR